VIIPILAFHVMRDGERFKDWLISLAPGRSREGARDLARDIDHALAAYVRGQAVVCLTMGVVVTAFLYAVRFPYAPLLGTLAALAEAIPYVGALIVCVVYAVVGLSVSPTLALLGPAGYLVVNQLVGLFITPRLMGRHLSMHPMAVLLAVLLGAEFGGFVGMLLALPGAAIVNVLVDRWRGVAARRA
jgi:predicted PurR-regulated permease PerM